MPGSIFAISEQLEMMIGGKALSDMLSCTHCQCSVLGHQGTLSQSHSQTQSQHAFFTSSSPLITYTSRMLVPSTPQWGNLARQITLGEVLVSGNSPDIHLIQLGFVAHNC